MSQHASRRRTVAVVLAGGTGERVGLSIPKQLLKIAGKSILEHTLWAFENAPDVDDVLVMMAPDHTAAAERIVARAGLRKVVKVVAGGATRSATTRLAIEAAGALPTAGEDCNLLLHDAVRPLVSQRVIKECVGALDRYRAVDVAIPSSDTVVVTRTHGGDGEFVTAIPDRSRLRRGQTPQGFRLSTIRRAHELAAADPAFHATDDCAVVLTYLPDVPVHVVRGDESNTKVTDPVDVFIADKLFQLRPPRPPPTRAARSSTGSAWRAGPCWSSAAPTASAPTSPGSPRGTVPGSTRWAAPPRAPMSSGPTRSTTRSRAPTPRPGASTTW